jgi:hypothetical protein
MIHIDFEATIDQTVVGNYAKEVATKLARELAQKTAEATDVEVTRVGEYWRAVIKVDQGNMVVKFKPGTKIAPMISVKGNLRTEDVEEKFTRISEEVLYKYKNDMVKCDVRTTNSR